MQLLKKNILIVEAVDELMNKTSPQQKHIYVYHLMYM